jgi:hypothetical protein
MNAAGSLASLVVCPEPDSSEEDGYVEVLKSVDS